jgi:hypothetical protein
MLPVHFCSKPVVFERGEVKYVGWTAAPSFPDAAVHGKEDILAVWLRCIPKIRFYHTMPFRK